MEKGQTPAFLGMNRIKLFPTLYRSLPFGLIVIDWLTEDSA